jgi:hypothetical protein
MPVMRVDLVSDLRDSPQGAQKTAIEAALAAIRANITWFLSVLGPFGGKGDRRLTGIGLQWPPCRHGLSTPC